MHQPHLAALAGAIALTIGGCAPETPPPQAASPSPAAPVAPAAPAASPGATATQPFDKPLVAQKPTGPGATVSGLIQSTDGDVRAQQVQANIQARKNADPFSGVPPVLPRPRTTTRTNVPRVTQLPANPRPAPARPLNPPTTTASNTPLPPATPTIAALPPLPTANLANAVEVTGVVQVGNSYQAIIKAPNEPTSRYVSVGQRLANGQVLVKRIEMNPGGDPIVILEENGIEVGRSVGEKAPANQQSGSAA